MKHAVYVGSFDPVTLGHQNIIERGSKLFDHLTIGVGINPNKTPMFTPEERVKLIEESLSHIDNIDVTSFTGLTVNFVRDCGATIMLRGVRTLTDIDAEFTMSLANSVLDSSLETVFLMADGEFSHVSSSLIKQVAQSGGTEHLEKFVPNPVLGPLLAKY